MNALDRHVGAVRRRMTFALFLESLAWTGLIVASLALVGWTLEFMKFWTFATNFQLGLAGAWVVAASILALFQMPSRQAAAVAIDERLGLKEKFSTALSM